MPFIGCAASALPKPSSHTGVRRQGALNLTPAQQPVPFLWFPRVFGPPTFVAPPVFEMLESEVKVVDLLRQHRRHDISDQ